MARSTAPRSTSRCTTRCAASSSAPPCNSTSRCARVPPERASCPPFRACAGGRRRGARQARPRSACRAPASVAPTAPPPCTDQSMTQPMPAAAHPLQPGVRGGGRQLPASSHRAPVRSFRRGRGAALLPAADGPGGGVVHGLAGAHSHPRCCLCVSCSSAPAQPWSCPSPPLRPPAAPSLALRSACLPS